MKRYLGHPGKLIRDAWATRYCLTKRQRVTLLCSAKCEQLSMCRTDECRRILLGVSS
jgi:hypothetical protein